MDDAKRRVAVLDAIGNDAERHEVVHLIELDALALQLLVDAVEALQASVDRLDGHLGLAQLRGDRLLEVLDLDLGGLALALDFGGQRLITGGIEVLERQFFELVLDLAHPEAVRDRSIDVERLLGGPQPPVFGHVRQRAHVVQTIGELDQDDADVVDHGQQHLAEVLCLPFLARRERDGADLGHPFDHVGDFGTEVLLNLLDRRQGVFDDVMQQPGGDGNRVEPHFGENAGNL